MRPDEPLLLAGRGTLGVCHRWSGRGGLIMTRTFILGAAAAAATFVAIAPATAQQYRWNERGWRTIGYTRVDGRDSDTIRLPGVTRQRAVRLCALNQPLHLRDFDIRFGNGQRQDV